ncbi:MAG: BamA/TamA family outer membrane protein [Chlorobium sp.]
MKSASDLKNSLNITFLQDYEPGATLLLNIRTALLMTVLLIGALLTEMATSLDATASQGTLVYPDTLKLPRRRYALFNSMRPARKSTGIALSGGGANGLAQIGILKAFEEEGIAVDYIAGTSIGAIIGGLYSCGYSPSELEKIVQTIPWESIISLNTDYARSNIFLEQQQIRDRASIAIRFNKLKLLIPKSLNSAQKITGKLDILTLNALYHSSGDFSSLPVNFKAIATDLVSGMRVSLSSGSLSEAMRASSTIPILYEPIIQNNFHLVDGGLVANLPVDELEIFNADYKIAVDTRGSMYATGEELDLPWKTMDQSMTILTKLQYPAQLAKADIVITPDLSNHKATDFSNINALIEAGYAKGKAEALKIRQGIERKSLPATAIKYYSKKSLLEHNNPQLEPIIAPILLKATDLNKTLQELLATDLFTRVFAELNKENKTVLFHLHPLPAITTVTLVGGPQNIVSKEEIDECFQPVKGEFYTNTTATKALENLISKYRKRGYSLVTIEKTTIERGLLEITLSSGKPGGMNIRSDKHLTKITPITREIKIDSTQPLNILKAEESVDNLYETGVFNRVSISAEPPDASRPDRNHHLWFSLEEKPASVLRLGLRYDETNDAQFLVDIRNENFRGTTSSIGGWLKTGRNGSRANIELSIPRIGSSHLTMSSRIFYDQHVFEHLESTGNTNNYGIQKYGINHAFGTRIRKNGQFIADITFQNAQFYGEKSSVAELGNSNSTMLSIGTQFTLDSRNNALIPTSGSCTNIRYSLTTALFDNHDLFWQVSGNHEKNIRLTSKVTFQLSGLFGLSSNNMLPSEKFFIGGAGTTYSQRFIGLKENALPCNNMAAAGMQLGYKPTFEILFPTSLFLHYNIGNAWEQMDNISVSSLMQGIGTSIILETPVGPARLTISKIIPFPEQNHATASPASKLSETILYFSIGHTF